MATTAARISQSVNSTLSELEKIWGSVGFSRTEQEQQIQDLLSDIETYLQGKIASESDLLQVYQNELASLQDQIVDCEHKLQVVNTYRVGPVEGRLARELTRARTHFEELNRTREEMENRVSESLHRLHSLWKRLDEPYEQEFETCGFLTDSRLNEIECKFEQVKVVYDKQRTRVNLLSSQLVPMVNALKWMDEAERTSQERALMDMLASPDTMDVSAKTITRLEETLRTVQCEHDARVQELRDWEEKINKLVTRLSSRQEQVVGCDEIDFSTVSQANLTKLSEIHATLVDQQRQAVASWIQEDRDRIRLELHKLLVPYHQQSDLDALLAESVEGLDPEDVESLFDRHELALKEIADLQQQTHKVVESVAKYIKLCQDRVALAERQHDINRFKDIKKLKEEEKMTIRIKTIGEVVQVCKKELKATEDKFNQGRPILWNKLMAHLPSEEQGIENYHSDCSVREAIEQREREYSEQLERQKRERKERKALRAKN